jgi:hypothetical protein
MKATKKATHGAGTLWTLGELVILAYDVTPDRKTAVKLLGALLGGQPIHAKVHSGG